MNQSSGSQPTSLVALLLNAPANTSGARTSNAVRLAADVLGFDHCTVLNLCSLPTRSVVELNSEAITTQPWVDARPALRAAIADANALLGAWGVSGLSGSSAAHMRDQVTWVYTMAADAGIGPIWMMGGQPRHPSRWHQYLSDKYGRVQGDTFASRIRAGLQQVAA